MGSAVGMGCGTDVGAGSGAAVGAGSGLAEGFGVVGTCDIVGRSDGSGVGAHVCVSCVSDVQVGMRW